MPHNNLRLGNNVGRQVADLIIPDIVATKTGGAPVDNVWIVYEDLAWTTAVKDAVVSTLNASYPNYLGSVEPGKNITIRAVPSNADNTYMIALWTEIAADNARGGAHLVVPILSDGTLGTLFGKNYGIQKPDALVCGINVAAQDAGYMTNTVEGGLYEITSAGSTRLNFSATNVAFIDAYRGMTPYNLDPLYTATGAYDAVNLIANRANEAGSLAALDLIASLEKITLANWWQGVNQRIAFDANHDCMDDTGIPATDFFRANVYRQWQQNSTVGSGSVAGVCPLVPTINIDPTMFANLRPSNETNVMIYPDWWT
jgi:ABC-type branched-subunit amino acid transport system substrate-binding protein